MPGKDTTATDVVNKSSGFEQGTPEGTPTQSYDYFGLKVKGADDPTIHQATTSQNADVDMISKDQAFKKYGQDGLEKKLWKDQKGFDAYYDNTTKQYNNFQKASELYRRAANPDGTELGAFGLSRKVMTDQQVAYDKGYAIDDATGKKVKIDDLGTFDAKYIKPGDDGSFELHIGSITDELKDGQAVSWMGPEPMHSSWWSKFYNGLLSSPTDIPGYAGGLVRMAGDGSTSIMNALNGKGFISDSELSSKTDQPWYDEVANTLRNISTGAKNQSEDYDSSMLYGITNMVGMAGMLAVTGGIAGAADASLGLVGEEGITLSRAATSTAMAGMVAEPFLKECDAVGIPPGKAAIMAIGVVAATSLVTHKIGADAVFNTFAKMQGDGVLKRSIQEGLANTMKAEGISDINKVSDSGWKKIVTNITDILSSKSEGSAASVGKNTFSAAIKGGLGMADFTLTQNAAKVAWDEYQKVIKNNTTAEQGDGLFYKRNSSIAGNLTEGVGSSLFMGMLGSGIFSTAEHVWMEKVNKGANSELRNRYMEKEIAEGRYDDMVKLIQKESKKGTWGLTTIGDDGNALKEGEQKRSMNDVNTEMLLKQASLLKEVYDKNITDKPEFVREKLGNDKQLQLEMIRNIGATKRVNAELDEAKKTMEDKRSENSNYDGKEELDKIKEIEDRKQRLQVENEDIASGKRYSRKYNGYQLERAGLPDVSDGMQYKLIPDLKNSKVQESLDRSKFNIDIGDKRVSAQRFISELPRGDFNLSRAPMMQSDLDASMQTIKDHGVKNPKALSELHEFVKTQLSQIPDEEDEKYLDNPSGFTELKQKLSEYNAVLENEESGTERNMEPDQNKFNENWLLNKNNPSGLETENRINELHKKTTSGTQADKQYLASKELTDMDGQLSKLEKDLSYISTKNDTFGVYRDIPEKHSGMPADENISKQAQDNVSNKLKDLTQKLSGIKEVSGKSLKDKQVAQNKLAHENLSFNHTQLSKIFAAREVIKFGKAEEKALADAGIALNKIVSADGTYNEEELNKVEKNHAIIDSFIHQKFLKDNNKTLWKNLVNLLLQPKVGFTKDNIAGPYLSNHGLSKVDMITNLAEFKKEAAEKSLFDLEKSGKFDHANYKLKTVLDNLERIRNIGSDNGYTALKNVLKSSWGKEVYPSFEQTNILQPLGFCINPDNSFINDWNELRGADNDTYLNNGISLVGAAGVGKNSMVLPLLLKTFKELVKDDPERKDALKGDILVMGPTSEHCDELEKAKRSAEPEGRIDRLLTTDIHNMTEQELHDKFFNRKYEFIIGDEASAFGADDINKLIKLINGGNEDKFEVKNKQARCLFLLDPYQSGPLEQGNSESKILSNTQVTEPYRINYRTGSRDIQLQGEAWKQRVNSGGKNTPLPIAHCNEEKTLGTEYVNSREELFGQFKKSFEKGEKPWLIVKDHTEAVRARIKMAELPESVSANILTVSMFDDVKDPKYFTAQGKQNLKIFLYMNEGDFKDYDIASNNVYARFMYTGVTRAGGGAGNTKGYCCLYVPKEGVNGERLKQGEGEADKVEVDKNKLFTRLDTITSDFPEKKTTGLSPISEKDNSTGVTNIHKPVKSEPGNSKPEDIKWETRTDKLYREGKMTTTSHEDSMEGSVSVANKLTDPESGIQYASFKYQGKQNIKGKDYEVIEAYGNDGEFLGNLYETGVGEKGDYLAAFRQRIMGGEPVKARITNVDPGQLKRVSEDGTQFITLQKFMTDNKHIESGMAFMRNDPKTEKPYLSLNIRPKGWKGSPVELAVFTPKLDKESIDNIFDSIKLIGAKTLFDYNKENPEILGTIDFNQSVIRKIIKQELTDKQDGISKYFMPLTEDGRVYLSDKTGNQDEGENGKVDNLKAFYDHVSKNEDIANQLYLLQGLDPTDKGKPGAYRIDMKHPNFSKLTTYHSGLGYPETQFDLKTINSDENKKPETDEFSGPVKKVSTNTEPTKENIDELFLPSDAQAEGINETPSEYIAENETEEEQENLKNDTALINIFGDSSIVDFVKKGIYSSIRQVINPGDIVKTGGIGSPEFKSLEQRIADYKKNLTDKFATVPEDIKNKINDPSFDLQDHLGNDEYSNFVKSAYIRQRILDNNVFDRFINKLYPGKKENYGGVKQENDVYNIDRNLGAEFKNILGSIPLLNFDKANWQQPQDSGFKLNPNTVISDIKALAEQEGWKGREEIKNNLTGYYTRFSDRTGRLEARENAMLSFCKHFFTNPSIDQTGKYSYSFIQDNKDAIQEKYPTLAKDENFQKHLDTIDSLMNHFYSFFDSNTLNNYYKSEYSEGNFKSIASSASSVDEIKNQFKLTGDTALIEELKDEAGDTYHAIKKPFDERYVSNILKETKHLQFEFNKDVKDSDIIQLFSKMGVNLDPKVPEYFRNKKGGWDRLSRIAGVFTHAVLGRNEEGLKGILGGSMRASVENPTGKPLPSDFFDYQRELAEAQHKVTDDAYRQGDVNVDGKFVQTTVLGSHVTDRFDDGGKHLMAGHQNNMLTVPEYAQKLSNSLNQVYNGKLSFDKIGKVDGIANKFGKSVKFGKDMTDLDIANFQLNAFAEAIKKSNKSQAYPIWGEYGGDGTNMRVYPIKIKDVNKLIEKGEFTKEFRDYIQNSIKDIFNINEQEFRISKEKWAPYLKDMPDEEWATMDHNQLENHFNELWNKASKSKKIQIATKIDNDPNFISHTDYMIKYDYDKAVQRDPETNQLIPVVSLKLGHATTFNKYIDPIFNGDNYSQKDNPAFMDHFSINDMVAMRDLGLKGVDDNIIKAYSLLRTIALKNINPLTYGLESQYKDRENYQKYGAGRESPGMMGAFEPGQVLRSAVVSDMYSESEGFGVVNRTDGKQIINPFYEVEFNKAFGGEFGPLGKGPGKFRMKGVNPVTGVAYDYKCQTMKLNWQLLDKSSNWGIEGIVQPSADHFMLEHYMKLMLHSDLYNHFTELRNSKGTKAAIETMQEELKSHPEWHDKMLHFLSHESVVKTGIRSRNIGVTNFEGLQHDVIYARDILHQLNLDKDTDSTQTLSRQMLSSLSVMKDAEEHLKNIDEATKNKLDNIWNDINKQIGLPKDSPEFYGKFMDYLRSETDKDLDNATYNYLGAKLMTNPDISLNLGMLSNMAENKLISALNKGMLPRIAGMSNVNDDSIYYRMRTGNDGNQYDYEDIRKMGSEAAMKLGLHQAPDEDYKTFREEDGSMKPSDIMSTYSNENRKRFGILPGENVNDIFTVHFKDGSFKNTANLSDEEFSKLIRFIDPLTINYDKSPMFRETDRFAKEGLPDDKFIAQLLEPLTIDQRSVFSYRNTFSESLNGFATRVPFGGLPFGKPTRIRSFIDDYGSTQISNGNWNKMDGQDLDGDVQYTNYFQKENPDKPEISENNKILKSVLDLYNNPVNKDLIFHEENIKDYQPEIKEMNTRTGLENTIYNYQKNVAGKNCIALEANFSTVYKALYRACMADPSILGKLNISPGDTDIYGKHVSALISTELQMALDNAKEDVLGQNNINEESIKLGNAILLYPQKLVEGEYLPGNPIDNKLKETMAFLRQPEIASIYNEFFKSKSVGEDSKKLHDIINERIAHQSAIADNHEKAILANTATVEDIANLDILKGSLNRLNQFKELEMLSEGLAQIGAFTSIYSKGIQSDHYKRDNMAHGAHGIEFLLNAPMDKIFNEEEYQKFTNDPLNKDWFKNRFTYAKDANNIADIERQHEIRANVNYKKFFDNSPVLKEMWKSYYNSADYITNNFMKEKPWNDFRDNYKKSVGLQGMPSSRMDYKLNREITKFCTSLFYNMNYGGSDKRITVGDSTDWYSLGNVNGRERFSNEVLEKFKDIKNNKQYSDNQVIRMLGISSERGVNRITLNGGNRIPADVMLSLQAAIRNLKDDSGIRMGDKKLSIYDMLSGYAGINDNFDSGGHSLVNLFDEKAYKNISNWIENTLMPTIKGDKKFELRDNSGNKVTKTWDELQADFKHKMLSDPRNKDLLLSSKKSGGAEYHTKNGEVIRNGSPIDDPIENSRYGYNPNTEAIEGVNNTRSLVNEGEAPINTPHDIQAVHYRGLKEGDSDIENFLKKTSHPIIQNERLRNLAESYLSLPNVVEGLKDVKVYFADLKTPEGRKEFNINAKVSLRGLSRGKDIFIDKNEQDIAAVFIHELHHTLLHDVLKKPLSEANDNEKDFKENISNLYVHAMLEMNRGLYGLSNVDEFVSMAFSDKKFQDELMKVSSPDPWKSTWTKLVEHLSDFISKVLGIDKGQLRNTLLNDVFAATHDYLSRREDREAFKKTLTRFDEMYLVDDTPKDHILALRTALLDKPVVSRESMDADRIRESIYRYAHKKANGDRIYYPHGDTANPVFIGKDAPTKEQIAHIQDIMQEMTDDKKDNFIMAMNAGGTPDAFEKHFGLRPDGTSYFSNDVHEYLPQVMDFDVKRGDRMISFDGYAKTLGIENEFHGNKPIVILHNTGLNESLSQDEDLKSFIQKDKNGIPIEEISVFDITSKNLTNTNPGKHIWETKTEKRNERQLRNYQLALTLMKIKEKKDNVAFKRTGVLQLNKNHINWSFDSNMSELGFLGSFKKYLTTPSGIKFMDAMPDGVKQMLKNPTENALLSSKYGQDYMWQLAKNWEQERGKNGFKDFRSGVSAIHKFMTEGGREGYKLKEILLNRSRELMRMNAEIKKTSEWKKELSYIDNSLYELSTSNWANYGGIGNISHMTRLLSTDPNVGNPYADYLNQKKYSANQYISNGTVKYKEELVKPLIDAVLAEDGTLKTLNSSGLIQEQTSKIFNKYIRKVDAKDAGGKTHRVNTRMLHFDVNHEDTKKDINAGLITKKEVETGKKFADELFALHETILKAKYEKQGLTGNLLENKLKDALGDENNPGTEYRYGRIPTLPKELGEKWLGINFQKMLKMAMEPNTQQPELLGGKTGRINNYFEDQMGSDVDFGNAELVGKMMGISKSESGEWIVDDIKKVNNISSNFEHLLTSMKMMELRQHIFDKEVIPAFDTVRRLADEAAVLTNSPMENVKHYFEEWKMANIDQKVKHLNEDSALMRGVEKTATVISHIGGAATTSLSVPVLTVVAMANTMGGAIKAVANSLGNTSMFGLPEYLSAASKLFSEKKKMNGIGDMYGVMNMSQRDIQNNPSHRILRKSLFSSFSLHWPLWTIDYTTREILMTAQMIKDGKYDAHIHDKETGRVVYHEKMDRQIWNADGTQTSSQKAIREAHRQGLIADKVDGYQKLIDEPNSPLPKGYSTSTGAQTLKDVSDQVIYNMGDDAHMNIQNNFFGRMVTQFKLYPLGQLEQAFASPYKRLASGKMVTIKDEYGNEVAKWQPQDYEGALHSVFHTVGNLKELLKNPKEFWENMTPKQKANLVALGADIIMFAGMWMIWNNDEIKKDKKLANLIKRGSMDLVNPYNPQFWIDSFKEPVPMMNFAVSTGEALWYGATGQFEKALQAEPIGKGDAGLIEQYAGYEPPKKEHKKKD